MPGDALNRYFCGAALVEPLAAWESARNAQATEVDWQFSTDDARIKLKRLYPSYGSTPPHSDSTATDH